MLDKKTVSGTGELCPRCRARGIMIDMHFGFVNSMQGFWICSLCGFVTKPITKVIGEWQE